MPQSRLNLGSLRLNTQTLLCIDLAAVRLWQHESHPVLPEDWDDPQSAESSRKACEYQLRGEQAITIADRLGWPHSNGVVFDVTPELSEQLHTQLAELAFDDISLVPLPQRISHRQRAELATQSTTHAGEVFFHAAQAFVVSNLPLNQSLVVYGQPCEEDNIRNRWQRLTLEVTDREATESQLLGTVALPSGTLLLVDLDALGSWEQEQSADGMADFLCWGPDARALAQAAEIPEISEGQFGWLNLSLTEIEEKSNHLRRIATEQPWRFSTEVLPHTHPFLLKRLLSNKGCAEFEIGNSRAIALETSWGDGSFEIYRDLDSDAQTVALRIELGTPERIEQFRQAETRAEEFYKSAVVSRQVLNGKRAGWLYREQPQNWRDSGWRVFVGDENEEQLAKPDAITLETLHELCRRDPSLESFFSSPIGSVFRRTGSGEEFEAMS